MSLPCGWRTRTTVSNEAEAGCSLREGVIPFQFTRTGRNVVDNPVVEAPGNRGIIVRHQHYKALCPRRHILPVKLRGEIGASTAESINLLQTYCASNLRSRNKGTFSA